MSESEKPTDHKGAGDDRAAEEKGPPIDPKKVDVTVVPQEQPLIPSPRVPPRVQQKIKDGNKANRRLADKWTGPATKDIQEAVERAAPGGRRGQLDAAEKAAEEVGKVLPGNTIKEVRVKIDGEPDIVVPATEGTTPPEEKKS